MLQLRIRLVNDDGTTDSKSRVLEALDINYTAALNAAASLDFKVSRKTFEPAQMPFLVRVEYAVDGGSFKPLPEHDVFIIDKDSDDSKDALEVVTYEAVGYVPWLLSGAYVGTGPWEKDNERTINGQDAKTNAGQIMSYFIDESKGRGWLKRLTRNFYAATDSAGLAWTEADKDSIAWRLETFYTTILDQITTQGMCDWTAKGAVLNLHRPGTLGGDKSHLVLGGQGFERVPVKSDVSALYTHVLGLYDEGRTHNHNTAAEARFGRRTIVMSQTGVKKADASNKLAKELLAKGQDVEREEGYEWTPRTGFITPFEDFRLGDMLTARSRGGKKARRVIGLIIQQSERSVAAVVQARVGEKISSLAAKNQKKLSSVAVGGVVGGSGGAFPTSPPIVSPTPLSPNGLTLVSNTAEWTTDGSPLSAVELRWSPVTEAVDGSEVSIETYEIWSREPSGTASLVTATHNTSVVINNWFAGVEQLVTVRAITDKGKISGHSLELSVTPVAPTSIVPKAPTGLALESNVGSYSGAGAIATVKIKWNAVTQSMDNNPITVTEYEVWSEFATIGRTASTGYTLTQPSGTVMKYFVRARTALGTWGDASTLLTVTGNQPPTGSFSPTKPELTTNSGNIFARWDGGFTGTTPAGSSVRAEARRAGSTTWVVQGIVMSVAGQQTIRAGAIGDNIEVRFVALDPLGRIAGASPLESIVVAGIDGADIIANTIVGNKITAGTLEVDAISPNFGENLNLAANGSIILIAGRQDDQAIELGEIVDQVETVNSAAQEAAIQAGTAQAAADNALGAALVAETLANTVNTGLTAQQAVFKITPTGAEIALEDGSQSLIFTPNSMALTQNGKAISLWESSRMTVNQAIVNKAHIGAHSFERYASGRTIIRPI